MSGNTNTNKINITREELHDLVLNEKKRDEFGFQMFQNPYTQAPFEDAQTEYRLKYNLKTAYDNQEFLRKMRTDIKREYLTRKKQLKKLQTDAAVRFREHEMKLQEHYSTEFAESQGMRVIDITLPLVHDISLPNDNVFDVRKFNIEQAFEGLRRLHREYYESDMEVAIQQAREDEEARVAQAARLRAEHEAEAAEAAEAAAEDECRRSWYELSPEDEQRLWFENTHGVNDAWSVDQDDDDNNDHDQEPACDDIPAVEPKERHASNAAAVAATSTNVICAKKKAVSKSNAAAATKARIAKQQQKKQGKKFVPIQITINDNRERHANNQDQEATAILSASKLEINLPKKNLQGASREAIKRHNQQWNRVNALAKQSGARGTRIETLSDPKPWYNNSSWTGYESD